MTDLNKKLAEQEDESSKLRILMYEYPDLDEYKDRWDNTYYCSESVNSKVDQVWFNHNCGCCTPSPLQAWSYIVNEKTGERIYTVPTCIIIGESAAFGVGEVPADDWEKEFHEAGINDIAIAKVRQHLKKNEPRYYKLEGDD